MTQLSFIAEGSLDVTVLETLAVTVIIKDKYSLKPFYAVSCTLLRR